MKKIKASAKEILNSLKAEINTLNQEIVDVQTDERNINLSKTKNDLETKVQDVKELKHLKAMEMLEESLCAIGFVAAAILSIIFIPTSIYVAPVAIGSGLISGIAVWKLVLDIKKMKKYQEKLVTYKRELEEFNKNPELIYYKKSERLVELESKKEKLLSKFEKLSKEYEKLSKLIDKEKNSQKTTVAEKIDIVEVKKVEEERSL